MSPRTFLQKKPQKKEKKKILYVRGSGSRELAKEACLYLFPNFQWTIIILLPKWILKNKRIIQHSLKCQTWKGTIVMVSHYLQSQF
jgi:hypothetical protein